MQTDAVWMTQTISETRVRDTQVVLPTSDLVFVNSSDGQKPHKKCLHTCSRERNTSTDYRLPPLAPQAAYIFVPPVFILGALVGINVPVCAHELIQQSSRFRRHLGSYALPVSTSSRYFGAYSLVPRPRPALCRLQYGKLGGAWDLF